MLWGEATDLGISLTVLDAAPSCRYHASPAVRVLAPKERGGHRWTARIN